MKKTTKTLYTAYQKVWGADYSEPHYFETIKERNAYVRNTDYTDTGAPVKLTDRQYQQWKEYGSWLDDEE